MVFDVGGSYSSRGVSTAEELIADFQSVINDPALAVLADGALAGRAHSKLSNVCRTYAARTRRYQLETLIVIICTKFTLGI